VPARSSRHSHRSNDDFSHEDPAEKLFERLGETIGNLSSREDTTGAIFRGISHLLEELGGAKPTKKENEE